MHRRRFLRTLATAAPLMALPGTAMAALRGTRVLTFAHTHTAEKLKVEYGDGERYFPEALAAVNTLLRDFRTGDVHDIDPALLDLLAALRATTGTAKPFQVISGYRSPRTNAMLHRRSGAVASGSYHMKGQAIDIRLGDVSLGALRRAAQDLGLGGVGYYPSSNFVHVDTGPVRTW